MFHNFSSLNRHFHVFFSLGNPCFCRLRVCHRGENTGLCRASTGLSPCFHWAFAAKMTISPPESGQIAPKKWSFFPHQVISLQQNFQSETAEDRKTTAKKGAKTAILKPKLGERLSAFSPKRLFCPPFSLFSEATPA